MDFLKKHYEKVLLGLVLAGLVGALVFLPFYIAAESQKMKDLRDTLTNPRVQQLTNLDLTAPSNAMLRLKSVYALDFETGNKVFNPVEWQKGPDGPIKIRGGNAIGVNAVVVTNITPLYLIVTLESVSTNELGARYTFGVEKQADKSPAKRRKVQRFLSVGEKPNEYFSIVSVKGAPENPDAVEIKLVDSGETTTVSKEQPYRHVEGYSADFRYDPEKRIFRGRRVGDKVSFSGTDYIVAEVSQNELILADQSNQKKTPLPFTP